MSKINTAQALSRAEKVLLWIAGVFTVQSVIGYAVFGLHPQLLAQVPGAITIFNVAYVVFAQAQIWLSFAALVYVLYRRMRWQWLTAFAIVYVLSLSSELLGTSTGLPFGDYAYTDLLGPKWFGLVPNLIPVSWFMMGIVFYWLAYALTGRAWFATLWMAAALTTWDLVLDPAMSYYTSYWVWYQSGSYYGMPWINSFGWFATGLVVGGALSLVRAGSLAHLLPRSWAWWFVAVNLSLPVGMVAANGGWSALALFALASATLGLSLVVYRAPQTDGPTGGASGSGPRREIRTQTALEPAMVRVHRGLQRAMEPLLAQGMAPIELEGQLLRPLAAYAVAQSMRWEPEDSDPFWYGALAIQLAHEASLAHDDILDHAQTRRGEPTLVARKGVGHALVVGDQWLTWSYRAAHMTGNSAFAELFARAVERTVHGEILQARSVGRQLSEAQYVEIVRGKSGELFGAAMALAPMLRGSDGSAFAEFGLAFGETYQRLDDLLDYLPQAQTGKLPYQDAAQHKWTWPVATLGHDLLGQSAPAIESRLRARGFDLTQKLLTLWHAYAGHIGDLRGQKSRLLGASAVLGPILNNWEAKALHAVNATLETNAALAPSFALNSRSFAFAARLLPAAPRAAVADLYTFCRFTDNLADNDRPLAERKIALERWRTTVIRAFECMDSGLDFLDRLARTSRQAAVPLSYPLELLDGARMDLENRRYEDMPQLRRYTYRVAGVLGQWLTRLAGISHGETLQAAAEMGHAMQLTNILRDVGEDRQLGRIYIPLQLARTYGVDPASADSRDRGYQALMAELTSQAHSAYDVAFRALVGLPGTYAYAFAAAAGVYRAILNQLVLHGFDNLTRRAQTTAWDKAMAAMRSVARLTILRSRHMPTQSYTSPNTKGELV